MVWSHFREVNFNFRIMDTMLGILKVKMSLDYPTFETAFESGLLGVKPCHEHTALTAGTSGTTIKRAQFMFSSQVTHAIHLESIIQHCDGAFAGSPPVGGSSYGVQAGTYKA